MNRLHNEGFIHEPWMGDPVSEEMRVHFNERVMTGPDNVYAALHSYLVELQRVRDALVAAEARYRATEGEVAELWGRA